MNKDVVERYIYAVTKRMPTKQREDVSMELRGLIDDMLVERCGGLTPSDKDIRVVLTELGTPQELYAKYDEDAEKCLIGQPYYSTYKFVLKIVLPAVAAGMVVANLILQILEPRQWMDAIAQMLSFTADGLVSTFAIVTALFAFLYHKGIRINESFNFDELPPVPKKNELIPKWESVSNIVFNLIVCVLFLFTPQVFSVIHNGTAVCLLDLEAVHSSWLLILLFTVCGIGREVVQLMEGRYNRKVLLVALGCDAVSAVLSCWWVLGFGLLNPEFIANVERIFEGDSGIVSQMFGNFDLFFLGVLLFALVLDAVDVTVKTLKK